MSWETQKLCLRSLVSLHIRVYIQPLSTADLFQIIVQHTVSILGLDPSYPARLDYFMVPNEAALHLDQFLEVILRNEKEKLRWT